jgi:hypothetical protein
MQSLSCHVQYLCRITHSLNFFLRTRFGQFLILLQVLRATDSQTSPSDYKVFPPLWTWIKRTRISSRYDSTATWKKLGLKSGWTLDGLGKQSLEGGMEYRQVEAAIGDGCDWTQCATKRCFGCRNGMRRMVNLVVGRSTGTRFRKTPFTFPIGGLKNPAMQCNATPESGYPAFNYESDNYTRRVSLSLHYTSTGHDYGNSRLMSNTSCSINNRHSACRLF